MAKLDHIAEPLRKLAVPTDSLTLDPANARTHSPKNLAAIKASLTRFGQRLPIVVQREGMVVRAGNGRVMAARELGWTHIAAVVCDDENIDAVAFAIADNRSAELADWDDAALAALLDELPAETVADLGFDDDDLAALAGDDAEVTEDEAPAPLPEPVSRRGDLWHLGEHRLLCGDSTDAGDWALLDIGERFVCFTSPPYNLGASMKLSGNTALAKTGNAYVGHDDNVDDYEAFLQRIKECALQFCEAAAINVQPLAGCKAALLRWMGNNADFVCDVMTWDKGHAQPSMASGVLASRYEWFVILSSKAPASRAVPLSSWRGTIQSVYVGPPQRQNEYAEVHGATFPVHVPAFIIGDLFNRCAGVVDCFCGTGTTIIAAEQLGRRCYAIEIEPRYVDVAIRRWQKLTGKHATLDGVSWEDVAAQRGVNIGTEAQNKTVA